jgi:hypothetical protein
MPSPPASRLSPLAVLAAAAGAFAIPLLPALLGTAALSDIDGSGGARRGRRLAKAGIALGILWFVVEGALAAILLTRPELVLAPLYRKRIEHGHASAARSLQAVKAQQELFRRDDEDANGVHDYWSTDIAWMHKMAMEKKGWPEELGPDLAASDSGAADGARPVALDGYFLHTVPGVDRLTQFAATAYPKTYAIDGLLTFYVDERGEVWSRDLGGAPAIQRLDDPAAQGWNRADGM